MKVRRIMPNFQVSDLLEADRFYRALLGLEIVMNHGWIVTYAADGSSAMPQVSFATEGGSGTPVPALSIEVDDVDEAYRRAKAAGTEIVYDITDEDCGVRRFFLRDPFGNIVNVLSHAES
ncbi:glyoxalase [Sinorhizobium medicae]|uniref:Glyoxalase n=1 Tax=Sinorhizobium medicae TaxID=110321 RepID=A0A6G1WDY3_9HYPH|nr:VOC family protein [Sinorhizobium medicae]MQW67912.1 glyoxalase [Sinorhizobium medicae]MQX82056.1 glyoxalase [Sinorhizobium medicae]